MKNEIKINDFLKQQESTCYLCVIMVEKNSPEKLRLYRWMEHKKKCDFSQYVIIDMDQIDSIYPTIHSCFIAEKKYAVVEVVFKADAKIPLTDLLDRVWKRGDYGGFKTVEEVLGSL